jgi:hypothetical protein
MGVAVTCPGRARPNSPSMTAQRTSTPFSTIGTSGLLFGIAITGPN